jgi:hypothetical protein
MKSKQTNSIHFPGNVQRVYPAGFAMLSGAGQELLGLFLDRAIEASRRRLQAMLADKDAPQHQASNGFDGWIAAADMPTWTSQDG